MKDFTYSVDVCKHEHLKKITPMNYLCTDCGKIIRIVLSQAFSYEEAIKHFGDTFMSVKENKEKIKQAERKREKYEEEQERKAKEELKKENEN